MAIPSERNTSVKVQGPGNRDQQDVGNNDYNNTSGHRSAWTCEKRTREIHR